MRLNVFPSISGSVQTHQGPPPQPLLAQPRLPPSQLRRPPYQYLPGTSAQAPLNPSFRPQLRQPPPSQPWRRQRVDPMYPTMNGPAYHAGTTYANGSSQNQFMGPSYVDPLIPPSHQRQAPWHRSTYLGRGKELMPRPTYASVLQGPGCEYCGEPNHNALSCRHGAPLQCRNCLEYGHKIKQNLLYMNIRPRRERHSTSWPLCNCSRGD